MYLASYDFEIIYWKGTTNSTNRPSRRPDYKDSPTDLTWLLTFQNKLKGNFVATVWDLSIHNLDTSSF